MVSYYWAVEEIKDKEIIDVNRFDTLEECIEYMDVGTFDVALVLDDGADLWRSYILNGTMTHIFRDSAGRTGKSIPKKYVKEFERSRLCR